MNLDVFADRSNYVLYIINSQVVGGYYLVIPKSSRNNFNILFDLGKENLNNVYKDKLIRDIDDVNKLIGDLNNVGIYVLPIIPINNLTGAYDNNNSQKLVDAANQIYYMIKEVIGLIHNVTNRQATINPIISVIANNEVDRAFIHWLKDNTNIQLDSIDLESIRKKYYKQSQIPLDISAYKEVTIGNKKYAYGPKIDGTNVIIQMENNMSLQDFFDFAIREYGHNVDRLRMSFQNENELARRHANVLFEYLYRKNGGHIFIDSERIKSNMNVLDEPQKRMFLFALSCYPSFVMDLSTGMFIAEGNNEVLVAKFDEGEKKEKLDVLVETGRYSVGGNTMHSSETINQNLKPKSKIRKKEVENNAGNIGLQAIAIILVISLVVLFVLI